MSKSRNVWLGLGFGYVVNGFYCMIRCFQCGEENYGPTVSSGYCSKCGHNANSKNKNAEVISFGVQNNHKQDSED